MIRLDSVKEPVNYDLVTIRTDDPEHPHNFSKSKKWLIIFVISLASIVGTFSSSSITMAYGQLNDEFNSSTEVLALSLSIYVLAIGLGPLVFSPISELYGRRICYLVAIFLFSVFHFIYAFAKNMATIIIARFFAGSFIGAFLTIAGGSTSDMFRSSEIDLPMLIFSSCPFFGPSMGPLVAGFIVSFSNWRWIPRIQLIWSAICFILLYFLTPETYVPRLETLRAIELRKKSESKEIKYFSPLETSGKRLHKVILLQLNRPFILFFDPPLFLMNTLTALVLAILYMFFGSFSIIFKEVYNFKTYEVGCVFLSFAIGVIISIPLVGVSQKLSVFLIRRYTWAASQDSPETQLVKTTIGSLLCCVGLLWFAFTVKESIHFMVPIIACIPYATGMSLLFGGVFGYIVEAYKPWAASALATNAVYRCTLSAAFPLFENQMYEKLGYTWANGLLAFLVVIASTFPPLFYLYGKRIRAKSYMIAKLWGTTDTTFK